MMYDYYNKSYNSFLYDLNEYNYSYYISQLQWNNVIFVIIVCKYNMLRYNITVLLNENYSLFNNNRLMVYCYNPSYRIKLRDINWYVHNRIIHTTRSALIAIIHKHEKISYFKILQNRIINFIYKFSICYSAI